MNSFPKRGADSGARGGDAATSSDRGEGGGRPAAPGVSASPASGAIDVSGLDVLLPYQRALLRATASDPVVVCEKSRRIGATWGIAADAVLSAGAAREAGGMDVFYVGYNLDMTREFIDTCAMWARAFLRVAADVEEFLFTEQGDDGADRSIQAFRIRFASHFEIVALCSRPRALRGRQGYVIIDEAAFHDDLDELLKAALALLIWGGKVLVISTHDGVDNAFNQLVEECRAGKRTYGLVRITFDEAISDGLFRRVCQVRGMTWSSDAERSWAAEIRKLYGDAASEELDCIPRASAGKYLPRTLLEARAVDVPVVRWACDERFVDLGDEAREGAARDFFAESIQPLLDALASSGAIASSLGEDFGRSGDLTVAWPLLTLPDLRRHTPFVLELRNVPFREQEWIILQLCALLPRFTGGAFDARGNGQYLAERARQRFGSDRIAEVMLSENWYREHMPPLKAALEDGTMDMPRDADLVDDLRQLEVVRGVARIPDSARTMGSTGQRHGDGAVAAALALFASRTLDFAPLDEWSADGQHESLEAFAGEHERSNFIGWM